MRDVFLSPQRWTVVFSEEHGRRVWAILADGDSESFEEVDLQRPVPDAMDPYEALEAFRE